MLSFLLVYGPRKPVTEYFSVVTKVMLISLTCITGLGTNGRDAVIVTSGNNLSIPVIKFSITL